MAPRQAAPLLEALGDQRVMKYILIFPLFGLGLIQVVTWFGVLPPVYISISMSIGCILVFLVGVISERRYEKKFGVSPVERVLENLSFKSFMFGLILVVYFLFNFVYSSSIGGRTKAENGKYFAMKNVTKSYYEISEEEYNERQPHQVRAMTGHPLIFGILGFAMFCSSQTPNKRVKCSP